MNEFTALHTLARPRSTGAALGAGGPRSDLAQRSASVRGPRSGPHIRRV